jgi:hypothetical protein
MTRTSSLLDALVSRAARFLKVPPLALNMFRTANEMSGLDRKTLPTELIPLNTIQLARGLLNFTALQALPGWVLPYWAVRQFDPSDPGFIPRSHLGLSMNLTRRNWTSVGMPGCPAEPVVDPRGAVTPFRNRWSIDVWLRVGEKVIFPSRERTVEQKLVQDLPVVLTTFGEDGLAVTLETFTSGGVLTHRMTLRNTGGSSRSGAVAIAVRPFNPEGVALTHDIRFEEHARRFVIGDDEYVYLSEPPAVISFGTRESGDSSWAFSHGSNGVLREGHCPLGLASSHAAYPYTLQPGEERTLTARVPLMAGADGVDQSPDAGEVLEEWERVLGEGMRVTTPDALVNSLLRASLATVLQLTDGDSITPGPWTYHQFWFRDAASMLRALDVYGFHNYTKPVLRKFPSLQRHDGFFRSQQGEWDSNGQALWTVWQHGAVSGDLTIAREMFASLDKGVDWIRTRRVTARDAAVASHIGLLPAGLSAEHLGLADHYFWDNWWALAGIQAYIRMCRALGEEQSANEAGGLLDEITTALTRAVEATDTPGRTQPIPAGPGRQPDCGMIGTCAAWYPLQIYPPDDCRMRRTLETLTEQYLIDGMFYQDFIHSGKNAYLTLHLAHAWLHAGNRVEFWNLFSAVVHEASPTLNYPEAIHPRTGGGSMGDGHHGWAAAEVCLAVRDAFVREIWTRDSDRPELVLLSGIPASWVDAGRRCGVSKAPVPGGTISIECVRQGGVCTVTILAEPQRRDDTFWLSLRLPLEAERVQMNGGAARGVRMVDGETWIECGEVAGEFRIVCEVEEN